MQKLHDFMTLGNDVTGRNDETALRKKANAE